MTISIIPSMNTRMNRMDTANSIIASPRSRLDDDLEPSWAGFISVYMVLIHLPHRSVAVKSAAHGAAAWRTDRSRQQSKIKSRPGNQGLKRIRDIDPVQNKRCLRIGIVRAAWGVGGRTAGGVVTRASYTPPLRGSDRRILPEACAANRHRGGCRRAKRSGQVLVEQIGHGGVAGGRVGAGRPG